MHVTRDLSPWFCGTRELFVLFRENYNFSEVFQTVGTIRIRPINIFMSFSAVDVCYFRSHHTLWRTLTQYQTSKGQLSTFEFVARLVTEWKRTSKFNLPLQIQYPWRFLRPSFFATLVDQPLHKLSTKKSLTSPFMPTTNSFMILQSTWCDMRTWRELRQPKAWDKILKSLSL